MVKGLLLAAAWAAAARIPICMLLLDNTDDEREGGCLAARLMPSRSCDFPSLQRRQSKPSNESFNTDELEVKGTR